MKNFLRFFVFVFLNSEFRSIEQPNRFPLIRCWNIFTAFNNIRLRLLNENDLQVFNACNTKQGRPLKCTAPNMNACVCFCVCVCKCV